jgi:hypothetical protein
LTWGGDTGLREYAFEIIEEVKRAANPKESIKKSIKFDRDKQEIYVKDKVFKSTRKNLSSICWEGCDFNDRRTP